MSIREQEGRVASTTQAQEVMAAKKPTPHQVWVCLNMSTQSKDKRFYLTCYFGLASTRSSTESDYSMIDIFFSVTVEA